MHSAIRSEAESSLQAPQWLDYCDDDNRVNLTIPACWARQASPGFLLDLHAPGDPWTALQLSVHSLEHLRFGERVNELIVSDCKHWALQRKASTIHNGTAALEADFGLQSNGAAWLMRKLYLPSKDRVFTLGFMTRLATWSRYGETFRAAFRSFSNYNERALSARPLSMRSQPRQVATNVGDDRALFL
jgi:hypothetical protein